LATLRSSRTPPPGQPLVSGVFRLFALRALLRYRRCRRSPLPPWWRHASLSRPARSHRPPWLWNSVQMRCSGLLLLLNAGSPLTASAGLRAFALILCSTVSMLHVYQHQLARGTLQMTCDLDYVDHARTATALLAVSVRSAALRVMGVRHTPRLFLTDRQPAGSLLFWDLLQAHICRLSLVLPGLRPI
jgi:hypothetical protein